MKRRFSAFSAFLVLLLFVFAGFLAWYRVSMVSLEFKLQDTRLSLETSLGRENKQQYEYDQVFNELPLVREEIALKKPLAEEAEARVAELKKRRKELKAEIKELSVPSASPEDTGHE